MDDSDFVEVHLRGGPYDGETVKAPHDFRKILMPGEVRARWVYEDDWPDEMKPAGYVRRS